MSSHKTGFQRGLYPILLPLCRSVTMDSDAGQVLPPQPSNAVGRTYGSSGSGLQTSSSRIFQSIVAMFVTVIEIKVIEKSGKGKGQ